jgi:hypothetical protein
MKENEEIFFIFNYIIIIVFLFLILSREYI